MIMLINDMFNAHDTAAMMKTFASDEELWHHIKKRTRLERAFQKNGKEKWGFSSYHPQMLADLMEDSQERIVQEVAAQACEREQRLIVIHQGEQKPLILVATPELDTAKLKRDWCKLYAKAHQLLIVRE